MNTPINHGVIASFIFALSFMLCVINVIPIIIIDINVTPTAIISNTIEIIEMMFHFQQCFRLFKKLSPPLITSSIVIAALEYVGIVNNITINNIINFRKIFFFTLSLLIYLL